MVNLSQQEEELRVICTWQDFDHKMWLSCFAPLEALKHLVADPKSFRDNVKETVLSWSDQIPLWEDPELQAALRFS